MGQIQRLRTEKNQIFQPVKKDTDNLQAVMDTVREEYNKSMKSNCENKVGKTKWNDC